MKFCRNFADNLENVEIFCEIFEFSKKKIPENSYFERIRWFEWFEWFGPSPIEPFNSDRDGTSSRGDRRECVDHGTAHAAVSILQARG